MIIAHKPRKMTVTDYETLKAKKNKTDQDYMRLNFFEEKFYNKSGKLANEFYFSQLPKLLKEYADYIESPDAVRAIYARVDKLDYHKGELVTNDKWPHRNHTVTVNGIDFEFHTGIALDYSRAECIFNAIDSVLHECEDAENYTLEEFLEEFCYLDSGESALRGINAYHAIKENSIKAMQIWKQDEIADYCANVNL